MGNDNIEMPINNSWIDFKIKLNENVSDVLVIYDRLKVVQRMRRWSIYQTKSSLKVNCFPLPFPHFWQTEELADSH